MSNIKLVQTAILLAKSAHATHKRKYTDAPYFTHLCEVAGLVASVAQDQSEVEPEVMLATSYLHDILEDTKVDLGTLRDCRGYEEVSMGVNFLTESEEGNRRERKERQCEVLAGAPDWVKTIKCADIVSNTSSIAVFDPKFARIYLIEMRPLLDVLSSAHPVLYTMAYESVRDARISLQNDPLSKVSAGHQNVKHSHL